MKLARVGHDKDATRKSREARPGRSSAQMSEHITDEAPLAIPYQIHASKQVKHRNRYSSFKFYSYCKKVLWC